MKTIFQPVATTALVAAALFFGASILRADDDTKTSRHHKTTQKEKAHSPVLTKDDRNAQEVHGDTVGGATGPEHRVRTGSHIPEHYNRRAYTTDSHDNEFILDKNDIRMQNSNTPGDALRQVPGVNVGGSR